MAAKVMAIQPITTRYLKRTEKRPMPANSSCVQLCPASKRSSVGGIGISWKPREESGASFALTLTNRDGRRAERAVPTRVYSQRAAAASSPHAGVVEHGNRCGVRGDNALKTWAAFLLTQISLYERSLEL